MQFEYISQSTFALATYLNTSGCIKFSRLQSSSRLFCNGVPVNNNLWSIEKLLRISPTLDCYHSNTVIACHLKGILLVYLIFQTMRFIKYSTSPCNVLDVRCACRSLRGREQRQISHPIAHKSFLYHFISCDKNIKFDPYNRWKDNDKALAFIHQSKDTFKNGNFLLRHLSIYPN